MRTIQALASVRFTLVLAQRADFVDEFGGWKLGVMYFLRSGVTGKFDGRPFYMSPATNKEEFGEYFKNKMVYVTRNPKDPFDVQQEIKRIELATNPRLHDKTNNTTETV